jgi:hypothetical protein
MRAHVVAIIVAATVGSVSAVVRANRSSHVELLPTGPMPPVEVP